MMATLAPILWAPGFAHQISSPLAVHLLLYIQGLPDSHLPIIMDAAPGCAGHSGTIWSSSRNLGLVEWEWGRGLHWADLESTVIPSHMEINILDS
uniref:Uncharacterized protein n=1 Tax=Pongo abelii TaxID=9601 RepID=H2NGC2_PONAB